MMFDTNHQFIWKISFTSHLLSIHCHSFSDGCVTKRTSCHSRYIGSTISTQTKMIARTKQDGFLSILTNHAQLSIIYQSGLWKYNHTMYEQSHSSAHIISTFRCCLPFSVVVSLHFDSISWSIHHTALKKCYSKPHDHHLTTYNSFLLLILCYEIQITDYWLRSIELSKRQSLLLILSLQLGQEQQSWKEVFVVFASIGRKSRKLFKWWVYLLAPLLDKQTYIHIQSRYLYCGRINHSSIRAGWWWWWCLWILITNNHQLLVISNRCINN